MSNPVGVSLGSAYGKVIISTNVAEAMQEARQQFQQGIAAMGASIASLGDQIAGVGARVTLLTAPLTKIGASGLEAASDFDSAMTMISARTGLVGEDLEKVRAFALKMGADTVFSSQQAADAFLKLLASGQTAEQALATLPYVLQAAAASGEDLGRSADVVTNILAAFQLEASASGQIVDELSRAASASKASIGSLGDGFANLGPVAKQYGLSVKNTAAVLAIFAQNGIQGAEAGTQLKSMLTNMTRPTNEVRGAWSQLGISMYDANGNARNLNAVIADLDAALDQLPVEEQNELMYQLAGSYGVVGLSALRSGISIEEMQKQMDAQASAADVAQKMMATFRNTIESLRGSFQTLLINAITPFMNDGLKPLAEGMINMVNRLNDWVLANPALTKQIVTILAALIAVGPVMIGLGLMISTIGSAVSGLAVLFGALLSPVGLLIAVAAAFGIAWQNNFLGVQDTVTDVLNRISQAFKLFRAAVAMTWLSIQTGVEPLVAFRTTFGSLIDDILRIVGVSDETANRIRTAFTRVMDSLIPMFREIDWWLRTRLFANIDLSELAGTLLQLGSWIMALTNPITAVGKILLTVFNVDLIGIFEDVATFIQSFFFGLNEGADILGAIGFALAEVFGENARTLWNNFLAGLGQVIPTMLELFNNLIEVLTGSFQPAVEGVGATLSGLWAMVAPALTFIANWFLDEVLPAIISLVEYGLLPAVQSMGTFLSGLWDIVAPSLMSLANWFLTEAIPAIMGFISGTVIPGIELLITTLTRIWNDVSPFLLQLLDWFVNTGLPVIVNFIQTTVQPMIETFFGYIAQVWTAIQPALASIYDWFVTTALPGILTFVQTVVQPVIEGFFNFIRDAWLLVEPALTAFFNWFTVDALPAIYTFLNDTVRPVVEGFFNFIGGIWELVSASLGSLFDWFNTTGMPVIQGVIENVWHNVVEPFINLLKGIWEAVRPGFEAFGNGVKEFLQPIIDLVESIKSAINELGGRAQALSGAGENAGVIANAVASGELSVGDMLGRFGSAIAAEVRGFAVGTDYVSHDQLALVHKGEAIIPANQNTDGMNSGRGGININGPITIVANDYEGGRAAGRGLKDELEAWEQFNG